MLHVHSMPLQISLLYCFFTSYFTILSMCFVFSSAQLCCLSSCLSYFTPLHPSHFKYISIFTSSYIISFILRGSHFYIFILSNTLTIQVPLCAMRSSGDGDSPFLKSLSSMAWFHSSSSLLGFTCKWRRKLIR